MMKLTFGATVAAIAMAATSFMAQPSQAQTAIGFPGLSYPQRVQVRNWLRWRTQAIAHEAHKEQVNAQRDMVADWSKIVSPYGLKRGDAVDALTAYMVQNWQAANSVDSITRTQVMGVRKQVASLFVTNPNLKVLTPAQRQQMANSLIYRQMTEDDTYQNAVDGNDTATIQQLSDASEQRFRDEMNLDLRGLKLTDAGLVPTLIRPADPKASSK